MNRRTFLSSIVLPTIISQPVRANSKTINIGDIIHQDFSEQQWKKLPPGMLLMGGKCNYALWILTHSKKYRSYRQIHGSVHGQASPWRDIEKINGPWMIVGINLKIGFNHIHNFEIAKQTRPYWNENEKRWCKSVWKMHLEDKGFYRREKLSDEEKEIIAKEIETW